MGNKIPFLDVSFELNQNGSLKTDIFYKETDTHNYVQFGSFHPHRTLTNIPFSLARRICLIVSERETRDLRLAELKSFLSKKKYPDAVIDSGIKRASQLNRDELLKEKTPSSQGESSSNISFVHTNNCANPKILESVRRGLDILLPSDRMKTVMKDKKIVAARRQPRNMKALLFRPRFETAQKPSGSILSCKNDKNSGSAM